MAEQHSLTEDYETPYKFNGKELDTETGLYYYGARYYDPRISIWLSTDPLMEMYPNVNPYAYCLQNPINFTDPTGMSVDGDYYNKKGKHIGNDNKKDNIVYVTDEQTINNNTSNGKTDWNKVQSSESTTNLTSTYGISHTDFLNRANWVYGEGGGEYVDHYAHTIKNLRKHGKSGRKPFESDEAMFKTKMTHQIKKDGKKIILNMYPGYFDGGDGNVNSKAFANMRDDLNALTSNDKMMKSVGAIIGSLMGLTIDPTGGAYQWVGGAGAQGGIAKNPALNNAKGVINVTSGSGKNQRYHTFYQYINP